MRGEVFTLWAERTEPGCLGENMDTPTIPLCLNASKREICAMVSDMIDSRFIFSLDYGLWVVYLNCCQLLSWIAETQTLEQLLRPQGCMCWETHVEPQTGRKCKPMTCREPQRLSLANCSFLK